MHSAIDELKTRADLALAAAKKGDQRTLARFSRLPTLSSIPAGDLANQLQRKHALWLVARDIGFPTWKQARCVLSGEPGNGDFGTLLYPGTGVGFLNHWYADYEEARSYLETHGGYLLAYRRQYLVVGATYVDHLGLKPDDVDWARMGHDWARPKEAAARTRLYNRLISKQTRK